MPVPLVLTSDEDVELFRNHAADELLRASGALQRTGLPTSQLLADWSRRCAGREDQGLRNLDDFRAWIDADAPVPLMIGDAVRHFYEIRRQLIPDIGVLWTILDISRHKQLEIALRLTTDNLEQRVKERTRALEDAREGAERAHLSKTRFFAAASHDLLQPLNAARIFASCLAEEVDLSAAHRRVAARIDTALRSAEDVIDVLVDVA